MASKPSMPRSREQRWSEQDHQRWRYHRRLLDYQSHDSNLKLPFVICTLGDHQYLWIIKVHIVIWNNFVTAIYLLHQRPHFLLKILLDHRRLGGSSKSLHSFETSCCWYQKWLLIASLHNAPAVFHILLHLLIHCALRYSLTTLLPLKKLSTQVELNNKPNIWWIKFCITSYQTYPVIVFNLEVQNMPRDTCQWLRHLILTTQSIILPVRVKLGVIYIKIVNVCSVCSRHLAARF